MAKQVRADLLDFWWLLCILLSVHEPSIWWPINRWVYRPNLQFERGQVFNCHQVIAALWTNHEQSSIRWVRFHEQRGKPNELSPGHPTNHRSYSNFWLCANGVLRRTRWWSFNSWQCPMGKRLNWKENCRELQRASWLWPWHFQFRKRQELFQRDQSVAGKVQPS